MAGRDDDIAAWLSWVVTNGSLNRLRSRRRADVRAQVAGRDIRSLADGPDDAAVGDDERERVRASLAFLRIGRRRPCCSAMPATATARSPPLSASPRDRQACSSPAASEPFDEGNEPITVAEAFDTIEARIRRRLESSGNHPVYVAISERLERLRTRQVTKSAASVEILKELLDVAKHVIVAERAEDDGHLDEVSILPDPNVGALTQILREYAPPGVPVIIENIVADIDTIVRQVRNTGWNETQRATERFARKCG